MQAVVQLLIELNLRLFETLSPDLTPTRVLTQLTLWSLVVASTAAHRVASSIRTGSPEHEIRLLLTLWAISGGSVLLWTTCQILLHACQIS
jgi:hypothetical protein